MTVLTDSDVYDYLLENKNKIFPKKKTRILKIKRIFQHSLINRLFYVLISTNGKEEKIYVKQFRKNIKRKGWDLPKDRAFREYSSLKILKRFLKNQTPFPYFFDKRNNLIVLSDIKRKGCLLLDMLRKRNFSLAAVEGLARFLGTVHGQTFNIDYPFLNNQAENSILKFKSAGAKKFFSRVVDEFIAESVNQPKCFVIGDFTAKNIFIGDKGASACDFELSMNYDGTFDLGHIMADYLIFTEIFGKQKKFPLIWKSFIENYFKIIYNYYNKSRENFKTITKRSLKYMAILTLHRTDGLSPYSFLSKSLKKRIRQRAYSIYIKERL